MAKGKGHTKRNTAVIGAGAAAILAYLLWPKASGSPPPPIYSSLYIVGIQPNTITVGALVPALNSTIGGPYTTVAAAQAASVGVTRAQNPLGGAVVIAGYPIVSPGVLVVVQIVA